MILGAAMLALAVVGCENEPIDEGNTPAIPEEPSIEEPADPTEPTELVLRATLPSTRTTLNSDYTVSWADGDQLAVFNAPTGTEEYSGNLRFKVTDTTTGAFGAYDESVIVPFEEGVNYDWYVLMPYRPSGNTTELLTPKGQSGDDGYFPIGAQIQTGYNNSTHVSSQDVMVGKVTNTRTPEVALKHLAVLHKFTVTNNSNAPTVITKLTLNGGENKIFGTFWIDLTADNPAIDINKANATFNERALTVKDGDELAGGESADFYMLTAPFTLNAGETFKITIETSTGTQTLEKTAESDITFAAGTYNTANLVYNLIPEAKPIFLSTFDKIITFDDNGENIKVTMTNGAGTTGSGYPTGGALEGSVLRFSTARNGSVCKWEKVNVDGNETLTVSYDVVLHGDAPVATTVSFKHRVTGAGSWITAQQTTLSPSDNGKIQHIEFNISVADPSKTIEFHVTTNTATTSAYLDNLKLNVPATE